MNTSFSAETIRAEVLEILKGLLQQKTGQDIRQHPEAWHYVQQEAYRIQQALENQEVVQIQLQVLKQTLSFALQRNSVKAWLEIHSPPPDWTHPPQRCPACHSLMRDQWECMTCGLALDSPEQKSLRQRFSLDRRGALPFGYFLLADPKRRRILLLHAPSNYQVVWQISFEISQCQEPVFAQMLPDHHLLVVDRKGHQVFICDRFGQKHWCWDSQRSPQHALAFPSFASYCPVDGVPSWLIVDQGQHRVLRVSREQDILWSYGVCGQVGQEDGFLNTPSDIQRTAQGTYLIADSGNHRVIEVNPATQKIIWIAHPNAKFKYPMAAQRLLNGHTLILDAGHHRIVELDKDSTVVDECVYFKPEMDPRLRMDQPLTLIRRENQNFILQDVDRVFEIMPLHKQLQWFSQLTDLRMRHFNCLSEVPAETAEVKTTAPTHIRSPFNLAETLRKVSVFQGAPDDFFEKIKLCLRFEEYPAGKILVREGQRGDAMYIIRRGTVEVLKGFQSIASLHEGEIFGEMALLLGEPRTATVRTQTPCQLYKLNKLAFETVIQAFPTVYERVRALVEDRKTVTALKTGEHFQGTEKLRHLVESHKARLQELRASRLNRPSQISLARTYMRMRYSPIEQHILTEAQAQGYHLWELHIRLHPHCRMKSVRISLLAMILEKHGTIIKIMPSADEILQEKLDLDVSLALVTHSSRSEVLEDASGLAEIEKVSVVPIQL